MTRVVVVVVLAGCNDWPRSVFTLAVTIYYNLNLKYNGAGVILLRSKTFYCHKSQIFFQHGSIVFSSALSWTITPLQSLVHRKCPVLAAYVSFKQAALRK